MSQPCSFWWSRSIPVCGCSQNNYVSVRVARNFWHIWQLNWVLFSQKYSNSCSLALNTHHCLRWIWRGWGIFWSVTCQGKILEQFYSWENRRFFTVTVRRTFVRTVLNHIRGCESCHAICLEFTMLELIAAIECKGPSAFSSSHPPQHLFFTFYFKGLVELVFFFLLFCLHNFWAAEW